MATHVELLEKQTSDKDDFRLEWARLNLQSLTKHKFFGKATFVFEGGTITRLIKEENIKP